ncbi:MFS transporter [uncultured Pseudonocardia sp.]|jgi:predicted MFS family arabinose efflux permease|uniref:MFS transporter n=1 Tax=uncultured Pseudonocardia sp. TaxID=211455 RepID=UPI00260CE176|nr:MFS transporter [uncultured Pseudonocardia sp.]
MNPPSTLHGDPSAAPVPRGLLALLTTAAVLIFAQAFMIAPLLPRLAQFFATTPQTIGLAVPAYLLPYGAMTLAWGPLSDRVGRRPVILTSLAVFVALTAATALVDTAAAFIGLRLATAVGASGVVPIALALIGDLFPYHRRGQALGWLFGGMAGGIALGAAGGALGEPVLGWHGLFLTAAATGLVLLLTAAALLPATGRAATAAPPRAITAGYLALVRTTRGRRTYTYVLLNAVLQSGVYTWLGLYLSQRYGLDDAGIGLALLGYGLPGFLFGPLIGRIADRHGRARLIPAGVALTGLCALLLAAPLPLAAAQAAIIALSLGYDMTQPPLGGIVTDLPGHRGQAMALNVFTLFTGLGLGALAFQALLGAGFTVALAAFGAAALAAGALAAPLFRHEHPRPDPAATRT